MFVNTAASASKSRLLIFLIQVQFSGYIGVDEMKLWDRCHLRDQAKTAKLEFSDNSSFTVSLLLL